MGKSCEEKIKDFIKKEYCDIEATELPKIIGVLPAKERLMNKRQMKEFIKKAEKKIGRCFAEFLELHFAKTSVPQGKRMMRFFWLQYDKWIVFCESWLGWKKEYQLAENETPPDYLTD